MRPLSFMLAGQLHIPDGDKWFKEVFEFTGDKFDYNSLSACFKYVEDWSFAVDGGAHVGSWTRPMADRFQNILAFEPEPTNYACLVKNIAQHTNVCPMRCGLGAKRESVGMEPGPDNSGMWHIDGEGRTTIKPLDDFKLQSLGFLKLDVEGYELFALKGAIKTLKRTHPVILIEENGLCERYGVQRGEAEVFLNGLGYQAIERVGKDIIFC